MSKCEALQRAHVGRMQLSPCQQELTDTTPPQAEPQGDTMQKILAALAVLTLLSGTVAFAAPANASTVDRVPTTENAGSNS
jgi:hypothetical protein